MKWCFTRDDEEPSALPSGLPCRGSGSARGTRDLACNRDRPSTAFAIQTAVVFGCAENPLHVVLRFRKRNVVDELILVQPRPFGLPPQHTTLPGVVAGERVVR